MTFVEIAEDFLKAVTAELDKHTSQKGVIETNNQKVTLFTPAHIQFAVYGRGPGKQPPIDNILKWVTQQGIIFEGSTKEGTAWAIAKSISKKGTKNWVPDAPNALQEAIDSNIEVYYDNVNKKVTKITTEGLDELYQKQFPKKLKL